jgi:hypothetical protein
MRMTASSSGANRIGDRSHLPSGPQGCMLLSLFATLQQHETPLTDELVQAMAARTSAIYAAAPDPSNSGPIQAASQCGLATTDRLIAAVTRCCRRRGAHPGRDPGRAQGRCRPRNRCRQQALSPRRGEADRDLPYYDPSVSPSTCQPAPPGQVVMIDQVFRARASANTRCPTNALTVCSISSGVRLSAKHAANRSTSRIARSVAPSSRAPASEVICRR